MLDEYESIWLVISSHGDWEVQVDRDRVPADSEGQVEKKTDIIFDKMWSGNSVRLLTEILTAKKSPKLTGKPVIIIIQVLVFLWFENILNNHSIVHVPYFLV